MRFRVFVTLLSVFLIDFISSSPPQQQQPIPYAYQDSFALSCQQYNSSDFLPLFHCKERGEGLTFQYGVEGLLYCTIAVVDEEYYQWLNRIVLGKEFLSCRIAMDKSNSIYLPVVVPICTNNRISTTNAILSYIIITSY
jgi:hypothetical protein